MALKDNLISVWGLNEQSGQANAPDSHGTNDLTQTGGTIGAGAAPANLLASRDFEAGDTEYFTIASNSSLQTGNIDFSVTAWVNAESLVNFPIIAMKGWKGTNDTDKEWVLYYSTSQNKFVFQMLDSGLNLYNLEASNFGTASTGVWYFVAARYDSVNNLMYISVNNGTPNTLANSNGANAGTDPFEIGASTPQSLYWDGLIAQVSFWKKFVSSDELTELYNDGDALDYYDWDAGDTEDSNTKLLMHVDSDFSDSMGNRTPNSVSAPSISSTSPKFGAGLALAEFGTTAEELFDKDDDFVLGTSDFTFDFWFRRTGNPADFAITYLIFCGGTGFSNGRWNIRLNDGSLGAITLQLVQQNAFSSTVIASFNLSTINDNTLYHIAISRFGDVMRAFKDGLQVGEDVALSAGLNILYTPTAGVRMFVPYTGANDVDALYDEFRFTKGVARWRTNFIVPTEPYVGTSEGSSFIPRLTLLGVG